MYELKLKMGMKILATQKKMFDFSNYSTKPRYYHHSKN